MWATSNGVVRRLDIVKLKIPGRALYFLEDRGDTQIFADAYKPILYEINDGKVKEYPIDIKKKIRRLFTLQSGDKLVQTAAPVQLCILDQNWKVKKEFPVRDFFWHGAWSIDQSANGTIMYAEYTATKKTDLVPLIVWASRDRGETWEPSLTLQSSPKNPKADIRHFHTCVADPDILGRWYVSTGDRLDNNRLYLSEDDGYTWEQMPVNKISPSRLVPKKLRHNIQRYTACFFKDNYIYWPTDDDLKLRPLYVRIDKSKIREGHYEVLGFFDSNLIRNIIPDEDGGALTIAESKIDREAADLHYITKDGHITALAGIPNETGDLSGTTLSLSSRAFHKGTAYSLHDMALFAERKPGVLRYDLTKLSENDPQARLYEHYHQLKRASSSPLIVFFHAQRTAGSTLKDIFKAEYGEKKVYYQRTVENFKRWRDLTEKDLAGFWVYGAHDNFCFPQKTLKRPRFYLSIVREPIERAVSLYHYLKTRPEHKLHELAMTKDLATFYREAIKIAPDYVSNVQVLRICGKKNFETARKIIEEHFSLVAPFERIDEAVICLEQFFDFKKKGSFEKKAPKIALNDNLDWETLKIIRDINEEDLKLYEFVKGYFDLLKAPLLSAAKFDPFHLIV
jgi:hypothetical protein